MPPAKNKKDVEKKIQKKIKVLAQAVKALKQELKVAKAVRALGKGSEASAKDGAIKPKDSPKKAKSAPRLRTASVPQSPHIEVRDSGVHGKGVFAKAAIPKDTTLIEYVGELVSWTKAQDRPPHNPVDPNHTFFFHIDDKLVIDAATGGNDARWINHACEPNCEADEVKGRVFIKTLRALKAGEELFYDYGLIIEDRYTKKLKAEYACRCGAKACRGTMLAPKTR
jgi:uncharacterized protein